MKHTFSICPKQGCPFSKKSPIDDDPETFCPECGDRLIQYCPQCDRPLANLEKNFCSYCGESLALPAKPDLKSA